VSARMNAVKPRVLFIESRFQPAVGAFAR